MSVIGRDELVHRIACALSYYCDGDVGEADMWRGAAEAVAVVVLEARQPRGGVAWLRGDAAEALIGHAVNEGESVGDVLAAALDAHLNRGQ